MAHITADRVRQLSTSTGNGDFTVSGTFSGFRTFSSVLAVTDTFWYAIASLPGSEWEVGLGTYSALNTITRTTVLSSSNAGVAVVFSSGDKEVFITAAASKFLQQDAAGSYGNFSAGTITAALTGAASSNVLKAGDTMTGSLYTRGAFGMKSSNIAGNPIMYDVQDQAGATVLEIGRADNVAATTAIDMHTGATSVDYDTRLQFTGGTGVSGGGTMAIVAGSVGIGNTTPSTFGKFVSQSGVDGTTVVASFNNISNVSANTVVAVDLWADQARSRISSNRDGAGTSSSLIFSTSNASTLTEKMRIDSSGNVGIGISPSKKLDVVGQFRVRGSTTSGYSLIEYGDSATATNNWHIGSEGDGTFRFYNGNFGAGTERMRIDSSGNVTPGVTNTQTLGTASFVWNKAYSQQFISSNGTAQSLTDGSVILNAAGGSILLDDSGHKRISWNDGAGNFNIRAGNYFNGTALVYAKGSAEANGGAATISLNTDSVDGYIYFNVSTIGVPGASVAYNKNLLLSTAGLTFDGNFTPVTTNTYTLGASGLLWNNVYATTFTGALNGAASSNVLKAGDTMTGAFNISFGGGAVSATKHIVLTNGSSYDLFMLPRASAGAYNTLTQAGDAIIAFTTGTVDTGNLLIGPWSASGKGIRIDAVANTVTIGASSTNPAVTNTQTLGTASFLWNNVYATTFTGALTGNASGSAATFTSTSQNSQFNSIGVGVAASAAAGQINSTVLVASSYVTAYGGVGQLQAVGGSVSTFYNAFLRNDGANVYLLSSAVQTTQALATNAIFNAYRPFSWSLTTGAVSIDSTGLGASFGGNVGIGTTSPGAKLEVVGTQANFRAISTDAAPFYHPFIKARGTVGSLVTVNNNDSIGALQFYAYNGTNEQPAATIVGSVDGVPSATSMPGRIVFSTTPAGTNVPAERMRIDNAGNVTPGTTNTQTLGAVGNVWSKVHANTVSAIFHESVNTISTNYTITAGSNAMTPGPITIASGFTVTVPSGSVWTIV